VPPEQSPLRILVVDDDADACRLLASVLTATGYYQPTQTASAAGALAQAEGHDVILLDHHLPDGSGLDLVPALRSAPGAPAVVLVTGSGDESLAAQALRVRADDYLVKDGSLAAMLPQVLERVRRNRAVRAALAAAERDLVHAERLAAIAQLSVTLHHTINNPLQIASAEADLLLSGGSGLTDEQRTSLKAIQDALGRIRETLARIGSLRHDQTVDYLEGVSMIDLSRRTQAVSTGRGWAILYLPEEESARVVSVLLRHTGFLVERVETVDALGERARQTGVSLVLLAGSAAPGIDPLGGFRPAADRRYTVIALAFGDSRAAYQAGADHVVSLPLDPGTFVEEVLTSLRT
jgi:DNA-binding response OmpR family regulator